MSVTQIEIVHNGQDCYTWLAVYEDETVIPEFDGERPDGRGFAEVDASRVKRLLLVGAPGQCVVALPKDATPVFFRRRRIEMDPVTEAQQRSTIHCVGWQRETDACYLFVFPDGNSLLSSDLQAV